MDCKIRTSEPDRFSLDPIHQMPGRLTQDPSRPAQGNPQEDRKSLSKAGTGSTNCGLAACARTNAEIQRVIGRRGKLRIAA